MGVVCLRSWTDQITSLSFYDYILPYHTSSILEAQKEIIPTSGNRPDHFLFRYLSKCLQINYAHIEKQTTNQDTIKDFVITESPSLASLDEASDVEVVKER